MITRMKIFKIVIYYILKSKVEKILKGELEDH